MTRCRMILAQFALLLALLPLPAMAQQPGGVVNVAVVGEPPTLDPMISSADLVGTITQHFFETLYTFDKNWEATPLLAEALPDITEGGRVYTITLRSGVRFHDGSAMAAADVVASLKRWLDIAVRGKHVSTYVDRVEALDPLHVQITLKAPYAPLLMSLAFNNSAAVIMPAAKMENPLTQPVGTGPYRLKERKADQYIQLVRYEGYTPRAGEPNGYGGARQPLLDEIRFIPVPDPSTRVEGALSGQFDYADFLPVEAYERFKGQSASTPLVLKPFGWPVFVMNTKQGVMADIKIRTAVRMALSMEDMLAAAFGNKEFYSLNGDMYPENFIWHTHAGVEGRYNVADPAKSKALLEQSTLAEDIKRGNKVPVRILTSRQYEFHYKMAQVAAEYLNMAGFATDLQVVDWATLTQRRTDPKLWDIYVTHSPFLAEPALMGQLSDSAPGWWQTPLRNQVVKAFNSETDAKKRIALWADVQQAIYAETPSIKIGDFNALMAYSPKLNGLVPATWPYFWNVTKQ